MKIKDTEVFLSTLATENQDYSLIFRTPDAFKIFYVCKTLFDRERIENSLKNSVQLHVSVSFIKDSLKNES